MEKRLSLFLSIIYIIIIWICILNLNILKFFPQYYDIGMSFGVSTAYAFLSFCVFAMYNKKLIPPNSYGLFLNQIPARFLAISIVHRLLTNRTFAFCFNNKIKCWGGVIIISIFLTFTITHFLTQLYSKIISKLQKNRKDI